MSALVTGPGSPHRPPPKIIDHVAEGTSFRDWTPKAPQPTAAKLTIVQVTDVYTLENFASLKKMLQETRNESGDGKVVSVLTGDFLAPYLLSTVDRGHGMMKALANTPIDYLTFGNHEADIDHKTVCKHVKNFPGTFINTNMQDHEAMEDQVPFEIIELKSPDSSQIRKVGLVAVLSDDPALYQHFQAPGPFGGATIRSPWEVLKEYKEMLESPPYNCDLVIPLQHLYVPDDHITCQDFDFPVILSGHDHHQVDETVDGTRLLKPGADAEFATVLEVCWDGKDSSEPDISARFVKTSDYAPCPVLEEENSRAYDALLPLRKTELARIPKVFEPLSSGNARGSVTTMGKFICSLLRSSLNVNRGRQRSFFVDGVLLMGGNIRGSSDYLEGGFFSLEALEAEIKSDEVIGVVDMPGWVLAQAVQETHSGDPIPGWLQFDGDVKEIYPDGDGPPVVTEVAGYALDPNRMYRIATKIPDLTNGQSPTFTEYYTAHPESLPPQGSLINISVELMGYFSRNLWRRIWEAVEPTMLIDHDIEYTCEHGNYCQERLDELDRDQDGVVTVEDIHAALRDIVGLDVHNDEKTLAESVHTYADVNNDGKVTVEDFELFCKELPSIYEKDRWRLAYAKDVQPRLIKAVSPKTVGFSHKPVAFHFKMPSFLLS